MMPSVPEERLAAGNWTLIEETSETRFELPGVRVRAHTCLYEDAALRTAAREHTGIDRPWRFFFATRLEFSPPLAPGIGPAMVSPTVETAAKREFATDLEKRGFRAVSRGRSQRMHTESGDRATLTRYDASYRLASGEGSAAAAGASGAGSDAPRTLPVAGWLAIWVHGNAFRLAGGAYPERSLADVLDIADERLAASRESYREELIELVRAVR